MKPEFADGHDKPLAVTFSYVGEAVYNFMLVGIDYTYLQEYKCYKQAIYQVLLRAKQLEKKTVRLGFSASIEKRKFGAEVVPTFAYLQTRDNYSLSVLGNMSSSKEQAYKKAYV